jgi:hypothetical protein
VRLKELLLTGSSGSVSWMPYAPEGATGIRQTDCLLIYIGQDKHSTLDLKNIAI